MGVRRPASELDLIIEAVLKCGSKRRFSESQRTAFLRCHGLAKTVVSSGDEGFQPENGDVSEGPHHDGIAPLLPLPMADEQACAVVERCYYSSHSLPVFRSLKFRLIFVFIHSPSSYGM